MQPGLQCYKNVHLTKQEEKLNRAAEGCDLVDELINAQTDFSVDSGCALLL
jgi:hypothetical protein